MPNSEDQLVSEQTSATFEPAEEVAAQELKPLKKPFVEPTISVPIDVLEATTYFYQVPVDAGSL